MRLEVSFSEQDKSFEAVFGEVHNISDGGYERGYTAGYAKGEQEGYDRGMTEGVEQGFSAGYEEGGEAAVAALPVWEGGSY